MPDISGTGGGEVNADRLGEPGQPAGKSEGLDDAGRVMSADTPVVPPYLCFAWVAPAIWPHAVPNIGAIRTTQDRDQVTCPSCLHALGSQKHDTPVGLTESEWVHEVLKGWTLFPVREGLDGSQMPMSQQSLELHLGRAVAARVAAHCENCATTDQWRDQKARADAAEAKIAAVLAALLPRSMRDNHAASLYELGRYDLSEQIRAALGGEVTP